MNEPVPADVIEAAMALAPLGTVGDDAPCWRECAAPTEWSAARTVEHLSDALIFYCGQVARRADRGLPVVRSGRTAPASEQLDNALTSAHMLAGLLRDFGPERAWHPSGHADRAGWVGMAVTELLVHGHDVANAIGVELTFPHAACARTVARVFPWVDQVSSPPDALLLAVTGRIQRPDVVVDPQWWWQSAPLNEWDGTPQKRTTAPRWR